MSQYAVPGVEVVKEVDARSRMSKTVFVTGYKNFDQIKVQEEVCFTPQHGQVMVQVKAAGVNFSDLMFRQGCHCTDLKPPCVLGFEAAGEIVDVGPGVSNFKVGQRVICLAKSGLWSEFVTLDESRCFTMPEGMSFEEGAALPINYITAHHLLFKMAKLEQGQDVLVHMVAGGVGTALTQLCKTVPGVTVYGTCSGFKHKAVTGNGVDHPIDYRTKDYVTEVKNISPQGVDVVLDPLNGHDAEKGYSLLKPMGSIVHYGAASAITGAQKSVWHLMKMYFGTKSHSPLFMVDQNKSRSGYGIEPAMDDWKLIQKTMDQLMGLYQEGKIRPVIDSVWAFEDVTKAMQRMHERKNVGKLIISPEKRAGSEEIRALTE